MTNYEMAKATGFQGTFKEFNNWRIDMSWAKDAWADAYDYNIALGFEEQDAVGLMDKIADETVAMEANDVRAYMEKVKHPALEMEDMSEVSAGEVPQATKSEEVEAIDETSPTEAVEETTETQTVTPEAIADLKKQIKEELAGEMRKALTEEVVKNIIGSLSQS